MKDDDPGAKGFEETVAWGANPHSLQTVGRLVNSLAGRSSHRMGRTSHEPQHVHLISAPGFPWRVNQTQVMGCLTAYPL